MLRFLFRLAALNADVERVEQKLTQLGEFSSRLEALTQVNDPARKSRNRPGK